MSPPFHRWFCHVCRQPFSTEAAVIEHITETRHTKLSYQRARTRSR